MAALPAGSAAQCCSAQLQRELLDVWRALRNRFLVTQSPRVRSYRRHGSTFFEFAWACYALPLIPLPANSQSSRGLRVLDPESYYSDTAPQAIAPQKFEAPLEPPQTHSKKLANKFSKFTMAKSAITRAPPADEEAEAFLIKPKQSKSSNIKGILAVAAVAFALRERSTC